MRASRTDFVRGVVRLCALAACALLGSAGPPAATAVNDAAILSPDLPTDLSTFGFFRDGLAQAPADGVTPYRLNTPLWSDGAYKLRFLYLPKGATAHAQGDGLLDLPVGAALVKSFAFTEAGKRRLIETRVLLHRPSGWVAASYQWDTAQTSARIVPAGARVPITTPAGEAISYKIPNRNQCKECHALDNVMTPIGPKARNLSVAWLDAQHRAGRLDAVPKVAHPLPLWEDRAKVAPRTCRARLSRSQLRKLPQCARCGVEFRAVAWMGRTRSGAAGLAQASGRGRSRFGDAGVRRGAGRPRWLDPAPPHGQHRARRGDAPNRLVARRPGWTGGDQRLDQVVAVADGQ